ncbi:hypothetical protein [Synechococcus sp. CS-197]|uniref:hypothetical protein n=1 Tax=Synechococcus sp. CS-197 TaxID=2847985 RepID=UPI0001525BD4|nr:hypothetical protein [Synechococcus sp. CS-197]MCT0251987.1 hypothetical protein [Synechococcus sp. CS-197]CAK23563.1 Uncharacterized conserved secreted protein [Synechococcus sp. WH 7803]
MQIVRDRRTLRRCLARTVLATALLGLGVTSAARADREDGERSSLMALLEPVQPQVEPVPTLVLERTGRRIASTGDPIWDLRLEIPGEPTRRFDAVSGRANRQNADRDRMGSRAPLPAGTYSVGPVEPLADGAYPELGPVWISIEPTFTTGRRVLGIHQDPSAGRLNSQSGTLGCIGLVNRNDMLNLSALIERSGTERLVVKN